MKEFVKDGGSGEMAFIGLFIMNIILILLIIGFCALLLAILFDIIWFVRSKRKKKTSIFLKILAVINSFCGIFMFIIPVIGLSLLGKWADVKYSQKFNSIEKKAYVNEDDNWREGFTFDGMELVPTDILNNSPNEKGQMEGALVYQDNKYYEIYKVENASDFSIYRIEYTSGFYVNKEELEAIEDFYKNKVHYDTYIKIGHSEDMIKKQVPFDYNLICEIESLYDTEGYNFSSATALEEESYLLVAESEDELVYYSVSLSEIDGKLVLVGTSGNGNMRGITLDDELSEKVYNIIGYQDNQ